MLNFAISTLHLISARNIDLVQLLKHGIDVTEIMILLKLDVRGFDVRFSVVLEPFLSVKTKQIDILDSTFAGTNELNTSQILVLGTGILPFLFD